MSKWLSAAAALIFVGFAACGGHDDELERQEIRVIHADTDRGLAVQYRDANISFVLDAVTDGESTQSRIVGADGTIIMQLTMPTDIGPYGGAAMMRYITEAAAKYNDLANVDSYQAAVDLIVATLANLHHPDQNRIDSYLGLVLQHGLLLRAVTDASSESPPCPEYLSAPTAYPYHTIGDHENQLQEMAKAGVIMPQRKMLCAWYNPCCLHDYACITCGAGTQHALLCGWNCTIGISCMGRCGGGCG